MQRTKSKWRYLPYIFLYFISVVLIGTLDTVNGNFDFARVMTADFWKVFVTVNAANWIGLFATFSLKLSKIAEEAEEEFVLLANTDIDLITNPYVRLKRSLIFALNRADAYLSIWLISFNRDRKKRAYKRKYQKQLSRLEDKSNYVDKMIYQYMKREEEIPERYQYRLNPRWYKPWTWFRNYRQYTNKRERLEELLSDSYIESNIDFLFVKYSQIKENFLRAGIHSNGDEEDNVPESAAHKKFMDLLPRFLIGTSLTLFIASFFFEPVVPTWAMIYTVAIKGALLIWNIISGREYAGRYFKEFIIYHEQMRLNILNKYLDDTKEKRKESKQKEVVNTPPIPALQT